MNTTTPDAATVSRYADEIMTEIRKDMDTGAVPRTVRTFTELHEYVDANMYVLDAMHDDYPPPDDDEVLFADAETDMANAVMDEVNRRLSAPATWCRTCGNPVENGKCACWCHIADALQQFLGRDFDSSAEEASRMWDALGDADKARVWAADYANDHDVPVYPEPAAGARVTIDGMPDWTFTAAYVEEKRWNGWACPWFTEAEGRKIAAATKAAYDRSPDENQEYVEIREGESPVKRFWLVAPGEDYAQPVAAKDDDGTLTYAIGAGNWTWEEAR